MLSKRGRGIILVRVNSILARGSIHVLEHFVLQHLVQLHHLTVFWDLPNTVLILQSYSTTYHLRGTEFIQFLNNKPSDLTKINASEITI